MAFSAGIDLPKHRGRRETNYIWRAGRRSRGRHEDTARRSGLFALEFGSVNRCAPEAEHIGLVLLNLAELNDQSQA